MVHSENGTQIDLVLNRLNTVGTFSAARLGIEIVLVATEKENPPKNSTPLLKFDVRLRKSLDDEHTPGVFNIINICSPFSLENDNGDLGIFNKSIIHLF